jgi:hypothetical protein
VKRARRSRGPNLSTWGSVKRWEAETREHLRRRHALWLHGWGIGIIVLAFMWAAAHLQMVLGSDSLAIRYLATLGAGYLVFLVLLRWWAGALVDPDDGRSNADGSFDGGSVDIGTHTPSFDVTVPVPVRSGGGGDFGGGGAQADFGDVSDGAGSAVGEVASGALEAVGSADEGAVVVIPVVVVFLVGALVVMGAGSLLLLYFGSEVLLAEAIELAFGYVSARTAVRVMREGWLTTAVKLTWKPLLGALLCAVLLGAVLDFFVPQARSLPHAISLMRS